MINREVAVSEAVKNYSITVDKIDPRKIIVIRNGIEVERFARLPTARFGGTVHFGIIGRLEEQKGHLWALDAFSKIVNRDWDLTIIGEGTLKSMIQDRVTFLHLRDKVKFVGVTNDIPDALGKLDSVVVPSRWEGLGLAAMEAQAAGRLVIATRVGGLPEIINDGETGILVEPENVDALAAALITPFENPAYARTLAGRARKDALAEFDVREMVRRYEALYMDLLV